MNLSPPGWTVPAPSATVHRKDAPVVQPSLCWIGSSKSISYCPSSAFHSCFNSSEWRGRITPSTCCSPPVPLLVHQRHQVFLCKAVLQPNVCQPVAVPGVVPSQVQGLAFLAVEFREVHVVLFLQPVQVSLNVSIAVLCNRWSSWFCVICRLAEGAFSPVTEVISEDAGQFYPRTDQGGTPLGTGFQLNFLSFMATLWDWQLR